MQLSPLGVAGAACATAAGYILQAVIGITFFITNRKGVLYLVRPKFHGKALGKACYNGLSEMVGMLSVTITMIAMNVILMKLVGPDGVAAAAIILSVQTILSASYERYVQGIAPIISFHYGAEHFTELNALYHIALKTVALLSLITFGMAFPLAKPIAHLFASGFFTALNDGKTSAILSLFRTLIFLILPLLILPKFCGIDGVWMSIPVAESLSILLSIFYFRHLKDKYHYA